MPLLLDTHIVLWLDTGDARLRPSTHGMIDTCWRSGDTIYVSAVTAWEIALLVDGGRIELDIEADAWIERFLNRPGIAEIPLSSHTAARACSLDDFDRRDPADRLLIATAIDLACPIVTYDDHIVRFGQTRGRRYGLRVAG